MAYDIRNSGMAAGVQYQRNPVRPQISKHMKTNFRILMAGAACILGCVAAKSARAQSADAGAPPPAPAQGYVWMGGHWDSDAGQWKWVAAHWELPPSTSATWIGGHWVPEAGKWAWVNGAWNIGGAQQAQSAPPQPPGSPGAMEDSSGQMVSPSSAAPYVDGEYGPGGVTRVVDQGDVVTDYGPVGYYPSYAGYGWDAYPWFWGGPFVNIGFGGRFGGYRRGGYYGHGGYRGGTGHGGGHEGHGSAPGHFGGHGH